MSINKLLKPVVFPKQNYMQTMQLKKQIVLHHTAGGTAMSAINWWKKRNNGKGTVATAYVIERDGTIYQLFSAFQWAFHLGVIGKPQLDRESIGIELVCWGGLLESEIGTKVPESEVVEGRFDHRGYKYFHRYTDSQIESIRLLLPILSVAATIPIKYSYENLFTYSPMTALKGKPGLYSHVAFREDKNDCHPQLELTSMLSSL